MSNTLFKLFLISTSFIILRLMYVETGQVSKQGGVYKCFGHPDFTIKVNEGDILPKCTKDKPHDALWVKVAIAEKESEQTNSD